MSRMAAQSNVWDFNVIQEPIERKGRSTGYFGNFREDTGECLGITSERHNSSQREKIKQNQNQRYHYIELSDNLSHFFDQSAVSPEDRVLLF